MPTDSNRHISWQTKRICHRRKRLRYCQWRFPHRLRFRSRLFPCSHNSLHAGAYQLPRHSRRLGSKSRVRYPRQIHSSHRPADKIISQSEEFHFSHPSIKNCETEVTSASYRLYLHRYLKFLTILPQIPNSADDIIGKNAISPPQITLRLPSVHHFL